jgi:hypothetical protein
MKLAEKVINLHEDNSETKWNVTLSDGGQHIISAPNHRKATLKAEILAGNLSHKDGGELEVKKVVTSKNEASETSSNTRATPLALGMFINQLRRMANILKSDWNWYNTKDEEDEVISQLTKSADELSKFYDKWMKDFQGHGVKSVDSKVWKKALNDFKGAKPAESLLAYEKLIKTLNSDGKPMIASKSKAAQNRLVDAWDTARYQLHGILSSFKGNV